MEHGCVNPLYNELIQESCTLSLFLAQAFGNHREQVTSLLLLELNHDCFPATPLPFCFLIMLDALKDNLVFNLLLKERQKKKERKKKKTLPQAFL